ncbi:hypothetical protein O6P43_014254 [Quillaja saponaria]|uniref:Uncharacterized protein n=1 Tax=Quillaja saponaria TaxID=32244 RepID=A0AAD7PQQ2_QUISA|nr:hypothetical protein O6P43_014254 [Quillaja saponaria]
MTSWDSCWRVFLVFGESGDGSFAGLGSGIDPFLESLMKLLVSERDGDLTMEFGVSWGIFLVVGGASGGAESLSSEMDAIVVTLVMLFGSVGEKASSV